MSKFIDFLIIFRKTILAEEKKIMNTITFESLVCVSILDFIKTFFYDFGKNNNQCILELNCEEILAEFKQITIYIAKMIVHFDYFYSYSDCSKGIGCLMTGLAVLKDKSTRLNTEQEKILFEWVQYVMSQSGYKINLLVELYYKISDCFEYFHSTKKLFQNLAKFSPLKIK